MLPLSVLERAAVMPDQVVKGVRVERSRVATALAADMAQVFKASQIGKTVEVLFERERDGRRIGHSGNYLEVSVKDGGMRNILSPVRIIGLEDGVVIGEIVH